MLHRRRQNKKTKKSDEITLSDNEPHYRFKSEEKNFEIHIGPKYFGFVCLEPYPGWQDLKRHLYEAIALADLAFAFKSFTRMSMDFNNEIIMSHFGSDLTDTFELWVLPNKLPLGGKPRSIGTKHAAVYAYKSGSLGIRLEFPVRKASTDDLYITFNITFTERIRVSKGYRTDLLYDWIESAHEDIYQIFVKAIRAKTLRSME